MFMQSYLTLHVHRMFNLTVFSKKEANNTMHQMGRVVAF